MSLLDILNNKNIGAVLGGLAQQMQKSASNVSSRTPGGMGGLLGAGLLGALFGNNVSSSTVRNASLLGVAAVAWNFYKKWSAAQEQEQNQRNQSTNSFFDNFGQNQETANPMTMQYDSLSQLIVRAMVFAARADGNIDTQEMQRIETLVQNMIPGQDIRSLINALSLELLDPNSIAKEIKSQEQAEDIYRLSCMVIDIDHFMERGYLDALAKSLNISPVQCQLLEAEASSCKRQLVSSFA